jgi:hypothetical protein
MCVRPPEPSVLSLADHPQKLVQEDGISKKEVITKVATLGRVPKKQVYKEIIEGGI